MPLHGTPSPEPASAERALGEHFLVAFDGTPIHYWLWPAAPGKPSGSRDLARVVLLVHGAGEYGERYKPFAEYLNTRGYHAAAIDLRGFGQSGGPRAFVNRFDDHWHDVNAVAAQILRLTGAPAVDLLAHSMGGLVCASVAAERPVWLRSLTLMSPCFALSFAVPAHVRAVGAFCSAVRPRQLFPTKAISELLTHDPEMARRHRTDPRIVHQISARLFFEMHRVMRTRLSLAARIEAPTAVFQAGDDRVVDARASREFYEALRAGEKRWKDYPGLFHELLNESARASVFEDVVSYLDSVRSSAE